MHMHDIPPWCFYEFFVVEMLTTSIIFFPSECLYRQISFSHFTFIDRLMTSMAWILKFLLIFSLFKTNFASVKLFKTENTLSVQSYDCVYYTNITTSNIQAIPYCIRTNESIPLDRSFTTKTCENSGKEWNFRDLEEMNVLQHEVLTWSSSIEMADRYAAYLTTG